MKDLKEEIRSTVNAVGRCIRHSAAPPANLVDPGVLEAYDLLLARLEAVRPLDALEARVAQLESQVSILQNRAKR